MAEVADARAAGIRDREQLLATGYARIAAERRTVDRFFEAH
ncbi:hypothetical protein [Kitasatospora sp. NPDC056531]